MTENNSLQKTEFTLEQTFERRLNEVAATGRKVCLNMGHRNRCSHKTKGKGAGSMEEFLGYVGTEKSDRGTVRGKAGGCFPVSRRSDGFELFQNV